MTSNIDMHVFWIEGSHMLRDVVLEQLGDVELAFSPGGENATFGQLLKEVGEIEYSYTQSLKTLKHDWSYQNEEDGLNSSIAQLKAWFTLLDKDMKTTIEGLSLEDLQKEVDRTNEVIRTIEEQLSIYTQAMMIFFGKAIVYLKVMNKPLPNSLKQYIG